MSAITVERSDKQIFNDNRTLVFKRLNLINEISAVTAKILELRGTEPEVIAYLRDPVRFPHPSKRTFTLTDRTNGAEFLFSYGIFDQDLQGSDAATLLRHSKGTEVLQAETERLEQVLKVVRFLELNSPSSNRSTPISSEGGASK
jgi:hypothetical protein